MLLNICYNFSLCLLADSLETRRTRNEFSWRIMQIKYKMGSYELLWTNTAHEIHLGQGVRILKVSSLKKKKNIELCSLKPYTMMLYNFV